MPSQVMHGASCLRAASLVRVMHGASHHYPARRPVTDARCITSSPTRRGVRPAATRRFLDGRPLAVEARCINRKQATLWCTDAPCINVPNPQHFTLKSPQS